MGFVRLDANPSLSINTGATYVRSWEHLFHLLNDLLRHEISLLALSNIHSISSHRKLGSGENETQLCLTYPRCLALIGTVAANVSIERSKLRLIAND